MQRLLFALSFVVLGLRGQFTGLATPADGSRVYFASPLRLKGTGQPAHGKLFVADTTGVRLVRSRERVEPEPFNPIGGWGLTNAHSYRSAEVSSDGRVVAADLLRVCLGGCRAAINRQASSVLGATPAQDADREGSLRLSRNGRYALRSFAPYPLSTGLSVIDLQTGAARSIPALNVPLAPPPGRAIADDGSVLLAFPERFVLVRPDNSRVEHALEGEKSRRLRIWRLRRTLPCTRPEAGWRRVSSCAISTCGAAGDKRWSNWPIRIRSTSATTGGWFSIWRAIRGSKRCFWSRAAGRGN